MTFSFLLFLCSIWRAFLFSFFPLPSSSPSHSPFSHLSPPCSFSIFLCLTNIVGGDVMDLCFFFRLLALFLPPLPLLFTSSPLHHPSPSIRYSGICWSFVHKGRVSALVSVHIILFFLFFFSGVFWCFSGGFLGGYVPRRGLSFFFLFFFNPLYDG